MRTPRTIKGFGSKYANPATLPTAGSAALDRSVAFSPDGSAVAFTYGYSPWVTVYRWTINGFGQAFSSPTTPLPSKPLSVTFSPDGNAILFTTTDSPYVHAYSWSSSGFGSKYSNPSSLFTSSSYHGVFMPSNNAVVLGLDASPRIGAYAWSSSTGFGAMYANPATLPSSTSFAVASSPSGNNVILATQSTPYIHAYPWSSASGFGAKYANPSQLTAAQDIKWTPDGQSVVVASSSTQYLYQWSGAGFGTRYSSSDVGQTVTSYGCALSPAGNVAVFALYSGSFTSDPLIRAYPISASGFGTVYPTPSVGPGGNVYYVAYSPIEDTVIFAHAVSPFITAYKFYP